MKTDGFLLEDYKLKAQYLTNHFTRMWTRFNFFLTIQSALFAFSLDQNRSAFVWLLALAGVLISLAWYFFGAADNYLVEVYRWQTAHAFHLLRQTLEPPGLGQLADAEAQRIYSYVGDVHQEKSFNPRTQAVEVIPQTFLQRRSQRISVTELSVVFPVIFFILWVIRIVTWAAMSRSGVTP